MKTVKAAEKGLVGKFHTFMAWIIRIAGHVYAWLNYFEMIELCFASGTESFIEFGKNETIHPKVGEVVLLSGDTLYPKEKIESIQRK